MFAISHSTENKTNFWGIFPDINNVESKKIFDIGEASAVATTNYNIFDLFSVAHNTEKIIDIDELVDFRYNLTKPLKIKISRDAFDIIGTIDALGIYAFGESEAEVLREINKDITELFEELSSINEDNLGSAPRKWLKILSQHIQPTSD